LLTANTYPITRREVGSPSSTVQDAFVFICGEFFRGQSFNSVVSEIQPRDTLKWSNANGHRS